ncbi:sirohydrochlorin chelatase [Novipirellula artificiosorum]|uniref:Sirohydrochlorin cobaltochelatase n=1 Tax=Novipirellula artificiosorum TaxID=2528016 RepID=A0A5C6DE88_9BACT|nr:sirohydrochlorin chelatase [Novipirellula artificiosorum]TWU34505.1 Sirohydrochlorin cobaltochelatase [Novipirellula artificiosorum]
MTKRNVGVLLVGHGTRDSIGTEQFFQLAELLKRQLPSIPVEPCLLEFQSPSIAEGWDRLGRQRVTDVRVAPLLLFAAGHAKSDIPGLVQQCQATTPGVSFSFARPISRHPAIIELVCDRLQHSIDAMERPAERMALVMVGRGSYDPCAQADMRVLSEIVANRLAVTNRATAFYAMAEPRLPRVLKQIATSITARQSGESILVHPHLLFEGRLFHAIAQQVDEVRDQFPDVTIHLSQYLGPDRQVAQAIAGRLELSKQDETP